MYGVGDKKLDDILKDMKNQTISTGNSIGHIHIIKDAEGEVYPEDYIISYYRGERPDYLILRDLRGILHGLGRKDILSIIDNLSVPVEREIQ